MPLSLSLQEVALRHDEELHCLFLHTNEKGLEFTYWESATTPICANTVLATSGMFSLDLISHRGIEKCCTKKIEHLVQFDFSHATKQFWSKLEHIVTRHDNRLDATKSIMYELSEKNDQSALELSISRGHSWLRSNKSYQKVKCIFENQNFTFVPLDFTDTSSVQTLTNSLAQQGMALDTIYLSNINEYSELDRKIKEFRESVKLLVPLCNPNTLLIDTEYRSKGLYGGEPLMQRVTQGIDKLDIEEHYPVSSVLDK